MNNKKRKYLQKFMVSQPLSDMLTRIRNASLAKKSTVCIPYTHLNHQIAQILEKEGYILTVQMALDLKNLIIRLKYRSKTIYNGKIKESCITNLRRISRPSLRIYTNSKDIPRVLGGTGIIILSTPNGLLSDREARARGIGGEILCSVW
jgi:small subunit ribosomal protein S8